MTEHAHLAGLNAEQRRAVEHGIKGQGPNIAGPLLIIAGAGSGKTKTLAHRVAHLVVNGADPRRILLLTFTRRAAADMERRAQRIVAAVMGTTQPGLCSITWAGTFHAMGARLLRMYAAAVGMDAAFTIHDREDSADLLNLVRHELGLSEKAKRFPQKATALAIYSRAVNAAEPLDAVLKRHFPWCAEWEKELRGLFDAYVAAKQAQNVLDYDDLLVYWRAMMEVPHIGGEIGALFDHVLVDEYQDTNALQAAILKGLKPDGRGVAVVGDDAQAIYGFRAADVRNILDFPSQYDPPATMISLEYNYRSTQPLLHAANAVIGLSSQGYCKKLRTDRAGGDKPKIVTVQDDIGQVTYIAETILANREAGQALKDQAVLFRTGHHSAMLEIELARRNIPFIKFGGLKFLEAAHVKDLLAILRWAENPADRVAGFRMLQLLDGVGPSTAGKALDAITEAGTIRALGGLRATANVREQCSDLLQLMLQLTGSSAWPVEVEAVRRWYQPHFERRYDDAPVRAGDLDQLQSIAATYPTRQRFLTDLTLDPPSATSDESGVPLRDEDYVILSTLHSAKGGEWRSVFLLNVVDGCIPSDMATGSTAEIEEERRLLYVGMTRAMDQLALMVPQRFYVHQQSRNGDRHVYASRTRFIPDSIMDAFDAVTWPAVVRPSATEKAAAAPVDLRAQMRGIWLKTAS
jgi:DNA helicase II / ATP-dependent DNA helicase PcrA